jgi:hypothetical protein
MSAATRIVRASSLIALLTLAACGGGGGSSSSSSSSGGGSSVPPTISAQPAAATVADGASASFSTVATGNAPLAYQWRRNGVDLLDAVGIAGATSAALTLTAPYAFNASQISVRVSNAAGNVVSNSALLTVTPIAPTIATQPADVSVTVGASATFAVTVTSGTAPVTYQWKRNGVEIVGATSSSYTVATISISDNAAIFSVDVINPAGTLSSATATLSASVVSPAVEHLYVAFQFPAAVYVYDIAADGSLSGPSRTIAGANTTLNRPTSIAVDDAGQLYVVNYGDFPNQGHDVAVFAAGASGNAAPIDTLLVGQNPYYVSYKAATFLTHPDTADYYTSTVVINDPGPITIVPSGGSVEIPPYIEPFATGFASYQASPQSAGLLCVSSVSPNNNGSGEVRCITSPVLWVTGNLDPGTAQIVNGYARNGFVCCGGGLTDLKFLPDGKLVVSNGLLYMRQPSVDTYVIPGDLSTGPSITPVASISGANTKLVSPTSIAYDKLGNLYIGDTGNASFNGGVHVYAPGSTGNVSPLRELSGLNYPFGIAIGP